MTRGLAIPKCARGHSGLPTELVFTVLSKHFTCHQLSTNYSVLVLVTYSHGTSHNPFSSSRMGVVITDKETGSETRRHCTEQHRCRWAVSRPFLGGLEKLEGPCSAL